MSKGSRASRSRSTRSGRRSSQRSGLVMSMTAWSSNSSGDGAGYPHVDGRARASSYSALLGTKRGAGMGLHTSYLGHIAIAPPLSGTEVEFVRSFGHTRHWDSGDPGVRVAAHPADNEEYDDVDA